VTREEKRLLRKQIKTKLKELTPRVRLEEEQRTCESLFSLRIWKECGELLVFIPMSGEFDTGVIITEALRSGKDIWAPRLHGGRMIFHHVSGPLPGGPRVGEMIFQPEKFHLEYSGYGIWEPPLKAETYTPGTARDTLLISPGLAFDHHGYRLGRGKGYYDRWFSENSVYFEKGTIHAAGVLYSVQLVESVPHEDHDIPLPLLIAGGKIIRSS